MHVTYDPNSPAAAPIAFTDFTKIDIRVGTVCECFPFPQARNPSYILIIDFGAAVGLRKSAAQVTARYTPSELVGRRVIGVVNFPPRQIGPIRSEVLVLGFADTNGSVVLATSDVEVPNGTRLA